MSVIAGIIVLSISILIHELGHLLFGRMVGIRAKVFSFGYGKGIFKKKIGDTTYQITAIPLGGYVRFYGDEIRKMKKSKPGDFFHAGPLRRIVPVLGGPLFNLFLGVFIFALFNFFGMEKPSNRVKVPEHITYTDSITGKKKKKPSPSYEAGMRSGDRIIQINDQAINTYSDIKEAVVFNDQTVIDAVFLREGRKLKAQIKPVKTKEGGYPLIGVHPYYLMGIAKVLPGDPFAQAGFKKGDIILSVNGKNPDTDQDLISMLQNASDPRLQIKVKRDEKTIDKQVTLARKPFIFFTDLAVQTGKGTWEKIPGQEKILSFDKMKDMFANGKIFINDKKVTSQEQLLSFIQHTQTSTAQKKKQNHDQNQIKKPAKIKNDQAKHVIIAHGGGTYRAAAQVQTKYFGGVSIKVATIDSHKVQYGALASIGMGFYDAWEFVILNLKGIAKLFSGDLSVQDNLSGPIRIAKMAGDIAEHGMTPLFLFLAQISVVLMVMNLLPIPVVDGGHIVFFLIEAAMGKPINPRVQEKIMGFFVILLITFGVYVIMNDILSLDFMKNFIKMFG